MRRAQVIGDAAYPVADGSPAFGPNLSLDTALHRARQQLAQVSGPEAALDARLLLEGATGLDRVSLLRDGSRPLGAKAAHRLTTFLNRRRSGEPVFRILGEREFWGLPFTITPAVLDPRPDTETLVAAALERVGSRRDAPLQIADLGVGSGAILCALLHELPRAVGWGVDRSNAACRVARLNVEHHHLEHRALIVNGNWADALGTGHLDLVVSNPPYIETATVPTLAPEVRNHDPLAALDGGPDGFACYRGIVSDLPRLLAPGAVAAFEVGAGQAPAVLELLHNAGLTHCETRRDLGGHDRVVLGRNEP